MQATFHQYAPSALYIGTSKEPVILAEESTVQTPPPAEYFNSTGCSFLDAFVGNLHHRGLQTGQFHAALLGISRTELCFTVQTLTGMPYTDFTVEYILLMAKDLMGDKQQDLKDHSQRLGFGSYSGFYRFIRRNIKEKPSKL